jgi:hypothetical protein
VSEAFRAVLFGCAVLGLGLGWVAVRAIRLDTTSPDRLVLELRLAQFSALLLVLTAGVYIGFGIAHENTSGTGLDVALAIGFFVVASAVMTWEPSKALTVLALAWVGHSFVDLAHILNLLPASIVPLWYPRACAIYDVGIASICYWPVLRR